MGKQRIKVRILLPLTIAIIGLMGAFVSGSFRLLNGALNDEVNRYLLSVKKTLRARHHTDIEFLSSAAANLMALQGLEDAWRSGDRNLLYETLKPTYRELSATHDVAYLSIYDVDGLNVIRVHEPARFGDAVSQTTLNTAREKSQLFFGMELSGSGAFVLSLVAPWKIKNQLVGYIELEKELRYITKEVPKAMGVELVSVIDKRYVDRKTWEYNYENDRAVPGWDTFEDCVVVDNTFDNDPQKLAPLFSVRHEQHHGRNPEIEIGDRIYRTAFFPLVDVSNRDVGDIVVFYDATNPIKRASNLLLFVCVMCTLTGLALFISFYKMLDSLEKELADSQEQLLRESQLRLDIEKKHAKELAAHVVQLEMERAKNKSVSH